MLRPTILISLAILLGAAEKLPGQTHSDSIVTAEAGARLYFAYCSACHVSCRLRNGILEIHVPISEASKPKQIQIQTGEDRKALHA